MTKQSDDKTTTISTKDKAKPQNKSGVVKDELGDKELEKATGGCTGKHF